MHRQDDVNIQAAWLLGFALFEIWGMEALGNWRGTGDVFAAAAATHPALGAAQTLALAGLLVFLGLTYSRLERVIFSREAIVGVTLAGVSAMILMVEADLPQSASLALAFLLQLVFKYLLLAWFRAFSSFDPETILLYLLAILGLALLVSGIAHLVPETTRLALAVFAGVGQMACLWGVNRITPLTTNDGEPCPQRKLAVILVASLAFCVVFRLIGSMARRSTGDPTLTTFCSMLYPELGGVVVVLSALVLLAAFLNRRRTARSFTALPFVLAGSFFAAWTALCLFFPATSGYALRGFGQLNIDLLFVLFFLLLGRQLSCSGFQLFALDEAVFTGAYIIVGPLTDVLEAASSSAAYGVMTAVLIVCSQSVIVFFVVMGYIILHNNLSDNLRVIAEAFTGGSEAPQSSSAKTIGNALPLASEIDPASTPTQPPEPRESTIADMARAHNLSERETEVMALLIKGRSMKRAAEELYLSLGTVNTYVKRIYAKFDIHTRQELIDRFEDARRSEVG